MDWEQLVVGLLVGAAMFGLVHAFCLHRRDRRRATARARLGMTACPYGCRGCASRPRGPDSVRK